MTNKPDVIKAALSVGKCDCDVGMCTHRINCRNKSKGGYCSRCDTVWAEPGVCNCDPLLLKHETAISVYEREVWNNAIEAAAILSDNNVKDSAIGFGDKIRELKK